MPYPKMKKARTPALVRTAAYALMFCIAIPEIAVRTAAAQPQAGQAKPSSAIQSQAYEGMITDTRCSAKHSATIGMTAADCTRACVHGGEHFVLVDGEAVYVLEGDLAALKPLAGRRARIVGILSGNKISVESVAAN
jgi:hypothetical protein